MGKERIHELNNGTHSSEPRFYVPVAERVLKKAKRYESEHKYKRVPIQGGYKLVLIKKIS
jgi:hypothetical protein